MTTRRAIINVLRSMRLIGLADRAAGLLAAWRAREVNAAFAARSPGVPIPPPTLIYEVQSYARADMYDESGRRHAAAIAALIEDVGAPAGAAILEWGCGPTRILARLPAALSNPGASFSGCDPDRAAIAWASKAYPCLTLLVSGSSPPLPYPNTTFDIVFGVSILTHLGERAAKAWVEEIARVLKPGGAAILTTHGEQAAGRLFSEPRARFDRGEYVALGGAAPGSRVFTSYMNEAAGRRLFAKHFGIASLRTGGAAEAIGQDVWVLEKPRV